MIGIDGKLYERITSLYVSDEFKLFVLTGQPLVDGGRKAYLSAKTFEELGPAMTEKLKETAAPVDANSSISLVPSQQSLALVDTLTGTETYFPLSKLDAEVQQRISAKADTAWQEVTGNGAFSAKAKRRAFTP